MKDFLVDIDSEHFENYFQNEIVPYLQAAEAERCRANSDKKKHKPFFVFFALFTFIITFIYETDAEALLYNFFPVQYVKVFIISFYLIFIFLVLIFYLYNCHYFANRKTVENLIYNKLLSFIGDFGYEPRGSLFLSKNEIKLCIQDSYLFGRINKFYWYDSIYGTFNGKRIEICEIQLTPWEFIEELLCKEYRGLFISTKTDLNLVLDVTICKKDFGNKIKLKNNMTTFKTNNVTFDKFFDVYTTNCALANRILTQDFVKEFLNVYYELGLSISCAFKNNKLYILILDDEKEYKDWFSFEHCKKSYLDSNTFKGILKDFLVVLKVVDFFQKILKQNNG